MKFFSDLLEIFDSENAAGLSKSIGIVVARVQNNELSDEEKKEELRNQLLELLNDEMETLLSTLDDEDEAGKLRIENRGLVFRRVLEDSQVEIFSAPTSNAILGDKQKMQILNMIEKLQYMKMNDTVTKETLGFRVLIEEQIIPKIMVRYSKY